MCYAQLQRALGGCTKTGKERGGLTEPLPPEQNLGYTTVDTPAKSSHGHLSEQVIATKDTMLLSPVPYTLIKIVFSP